MPSHPVQGIMHMYTPQMSSTNLARWLTSTTRQYNDKDWQWELELASLNIKLLNNHLTGEKNTVK